MGLVAAFLILFLGLAGDSFADEVVDGRIGPGALYRLVRPTNWNGSLVVSAHGFVGSGPVALPGEGDLIIGLLAPQGFAVAFSSFSENGWNVKDGAQRTFQLLGLFTSKFGSPSRVYSWWDFDGRTDRHQAGGGPPQRVLRCAVSLCRRRWLAPPVRLSRQRSRALRLLLSGGPSRLGGRGAAGYRHRSSDLLPAGAAICRIRPARWRSPASRRRRCRF